jgi:hypothetical protein
MGDLRPLACRGYTTLRQHFYWAERSFQRPTTSPQNQAALQNPNHFAPGWSFGEG